jgi:hypothetical protein
VYFRVHIRTHSCCDLRVYTPLQLLDPSPADKMPIHLHNITHHLVRNMTDNDDLDSLLYGPASGICQNEVENLHMRILILWIAVLCFCFSSLCISISHCVFIGGYRRLQRRLENFHDEKTASAITDAHGNKSKPSSVFSRMCGESRKDSPYERDREAEIRRYATSWKVNGRRSSLTLSV